MKKFITPLRTQGLIVFTCFALLSCSLNPELVENPVTPSSSTANDKSENQLVLPFPFPVIINRVDLFLERGVSLTGTVTVQITNADGTIVLGSSIVAGNSILLGTGLIKNSFYFTDMNLGSDTKYRIRVVRSNPHNFSDADYLFWGSTGREDVDLYPKGNSSIQSEVGFIDFGFISFSDGYSDQKQSKTNYAYAILNNKFRWQEFVPSKIWITKL